MILLNLRPCKKTKLTTVKSPEEAEQSWRDYEGSLRQVKHLKGVKIYILGEGTTTSIPVVGVLIEDMLIPHSGRLLQIARSHFATHREATLEISPQARKELGQTQNGKEFLANLETASTKFRTS